MTRLIALIAILLVASGTRMPPTFAIHVFPVQNTTAHKAAPKDAARIGCEIGQNYADSVSRQYAQSVAALNLAIASKDQIESLEKKMRDYLTHRIGGEVSSGKTQAAVSAIRDRMAKYAPNSFTEVQLLGQFDMLCWQLWLFAERRELDPAAMQRRNAQQNWMRNYVLGLPKVSGATGKVMTHANRLECLKTKVINNRLSPFFHEPMTTHEFAEFQRILLERQKGNGPNRLIYSPAHIFAACVESRVEALLAAYPPGFAVGELAIGNTEDFSFSKEKSFARLGTMRTAR